MKSGQSFSIRGALGTCHGVTPNKENVFDIMTRLCSNRSATLDKLSVDNIIKHHTGEVALHHMRHGNVVFPIFPRDLCLLEDCPSVVIDDQIQCWNSMNRNLPRLSLTSPTFSDGVADYAPWRMAPAWFSCSLPTYVHSFCNDEYNKNYSGFTYLPEAFRMDDRLSQEELSTCTMCIDYYVDALKMTVTTESQDGTAAAE